MSQIEKVRLGELERNENDIGEKERLNEGNEMNRAISGEKGKSQDKREVQKINQNHYFFVSFPILKGIV